MAETQTETSLRQQVLDSAARAVLTDRRKEYGLPEDNFRNIGSLWAPHKNVYFTRADVAIFNILQKVARLMDNPTHFDSWVDIAGYAACGAEAAAADASEMIKVQVHERSDIQTVRNSE